MQAIAFDDCAGWLHPAAGLHGVVLCNGFGYDDVCTHRAWLLLAEKLAAQQMPTLRFDYPGTGNSLGVEEDPGRIDAWIHSIAAAVDYLRAASGVQQVSLCGFRLGAALAALAAQRLSDVDGLALLAPVLSGKKYLRELHGHQQRWLSSMRNDIFNSAAPHGGPTVEALGFGVHGDDVARLAAIDLRTDEPAPVRRMLLLDANDRGGGDTLVARYLERGVSVERDRFDELDRFLVEARFAKLPVHAFATVSAWLAKGAETARRAGSAGSPRHDENKEDAAPDPLAIPEVPQLAGPHFVEQRVSFDGCFGVYCRPQAPRASAPAVLIPNTAANHNIGDGRCFVLFARRLASLGIASLRMDLSGLGDSAPAQRIITQDSLHSAEATADVMAGANWLVAQGHASIVTFGICSGAYVGFHACVAHPNIMGSFGVNLPQFVWQGERRANRDGGGLPSNRTLRRSAFSAEKWKLILSNRAMLARTARGVSRRASRRLQRRVADLMDATVGWSFAPNSARRLIERLHDKGAELRLVYGDFDIGIDDLKLQFGATLRGLRRFPRVRVDVLPILDHALLTRAARESVMSDAEQWLLERFCMLSEPAVRASSAPHVSITAARASDT
ncbi:MAG TPA: alpha/beta fold hydrolase [Paraburkholderia sp.]|jgi:pimeloyl-ACP methyl ester carboxylesterase|nr:alpha/beta fold hydrolase [Paraburkholderia sp.]